MRHNEQIATTQETFAWQVSSLVEVITDIGNPFTEEGLDTCDIMDEAAKTVRWAEELGVQQYQAFTE